MKKADGEILVLPSVFNPNRSLEKLAFTLLEICYNYGNNQVAYHNLDCNKKLLTYVLLVKNL